MGLPYLNLFIGDIVKDTDLLSPAAFGGYVRLMFKMHNAPVRGEVAYTLPQLCRVFGAETNENALTILAELINPETNIVDYNKDGDKHFLRNRRMVRETALSQVRSDAGKKGAAKTNSKNRQTENLAGSFAAPNSAGDAGIIAEEVVTSNDSANNPSNNGIGNGINNSNERREEGSEEGKMGPTIYQGAKVLIVPELWSVWRSAKPDYILTEDDQQSLRKIAEMIAQAKKMNDYTSIDSVDEIKSSWQIIVDFIQTDSLYRDFQLSQVSKYLNAIVSKIKNSINEAGTSKARASIIKNNFDTSAEARELIGKKYGDNKNSNQ